MIEQYNPSPLRGAPFTQGSLLSRAEKMLSDEIMLVLGVSADEAMEKIDKAIE
ncbi:MAG: hypothetical protein IJW66_00610 [Clostridia bacterium]|nr:hypothetical protein [Clostridia bacterium]